MNEPANVDAHMYRTILQRFLCLVGWHDWYVLDSKSYPEIDREVACEIDPLLNGEFRRYRIGFYQLQNKFCLCCKKTVNQIDVYRTNRQARMRVVADMFGVEAIEPKKLRKPITPPPPPPPKST